MPRLGGGALRRDPHSRAGGGPAGSGSIVRLAVQGLNLPASSRLSRLWNSSHQPGRRLGAPGFFVSVTPGRGTLRSRAISEFSAAGSARVGALNPHSPEGTNRSLGSGSCDCSGRSGRLELGAKRSAPPARRGRTSDKTLDDLADFDVGLVIEVGLLHLHRCARSLR